MPHERALSEAAHMLVGRVCHRVAGAIDEDAHRLRLVLRIHHCPHARRALRVESGVDDFGTLRHRDFLFIGDLDLVFVDGLHVFGVEWPFGLNKSDAGNGSKRICCVFKVSSSPSPDLKRSTKKGSDLPSGGSSRWLQVVPEVFRGNEPLVGVVLGVASDHVARFWRSVFTVRLRDADV